MKTQLSISEMVAEYRKSGLIYQPPKRRRDKAAKEAEMRALHTIMSRNPDDDSDFDDSFISDHVWDMMYKHENKEYDQLIFNIFRQDKVPNQEKKVNVTLAASVRDCKEKAEEIAMWSKHANPVLSRAPRKRKINDLEKAKRDAELNRVLADFVKEMIQPSIEKKDTKSKKKKT